MIIGLDVGGTHTDVVLLGSEGLLKEFKIATDPLGSVPNRPLGPGKPSPPVSIRNKSAASCSALP